MNTAIVVLILAASACHAMTAFESPHAATTWYMYTPGCTRFHYQGPDSTADVWVVHVQSGNTRLLHETIQLTSSSFYSEADIYCAGILPGDIHVRLVTDSGATFDSDVFTLVVDAVGNWVPSTCSNTPASGTPTPTPSVSPTTTRSASSTASTTQSASSTPSTTQSASSTPSTTNSALPTTSNTPTPTPSTTESAPATPSSTGTPTRTATPSTTASTTATAPPTPSRTPSTTATAPPTPSGTPSVTPVVVPPVAGCPACASTFPGSCPLPGDSYCPCMFYDAAQGLCWTWASPCAGSCSDLGYVNGFAPGDPALLPGSMSGWRIPTCGEKAAGPTSPQLQATGCSSCIFDPSHDHCDFGDPVICGSVPNNSHETWLVKPCSP